MLHSPNRPEAAELVAPSTAQDWVRILARYRDPHHGRSFLELGLSVLPLLAIWVVAFWVYQYSAIAALGLALVNGGFLLRTFVIQHDCGHGSFFRNRALADWIGRGLGVLTLTPYDVWRRSHAIHHASAGNLDKRGMGDVTTLTVAEYQALGFWRRLQYRAYRNPITLFVIGPAYIFLIQNRIPYGLMKAGAEFWVSAIGTNLALVLGVGTLVYFLGHGAVLTVLLPTALLAASAGVWLFYIQHQFEETLWDRDENWQLHHAALEGSSHYILPAPLRWMSANIGIHHVHHLYSRIPFYRLTEVLRDHAELAEAQRMTLWESLCNARLHLWDESSRRLLSFAEARKLAKA